MMRTVWFVFIETRGTWMLGEPHFDSRRTAEKWASKWWGDRRVRYVSVEVEEPKR